MSKKNTPEVLWFSPSHSRNGYTWKFERLPSGRLGDKK